MGLSICYGEVDRDEERLNFLDTRIGKWFAHSGKCKDIFLVTKVGLASNPADGHWPNRDPDYVKAQFENSLKDLQTDYIDLYFLHRADPTGPIEGRKTIRAMAKFVKEGKLKYIGMSEVSVSTLRRAHAVHPITALEVEYSPFDLGIESNTAGSKEKGLLDAARELGITVVAYSPLGRGLLSGNYKSPDDFAPDDFRRLLDRFSVEHFQPILEHADGLKAIGTKHNATVGQVAIAWLLAAIPGTKKVKYLDENLASAKVKLSKEEVDVVRRLADATMKTVTGKRYPGFMDTFTYADTPAL